MDVPALPLKSRMEGVLKQAAEYREHAGECRKLANAARKEIERTQLLEMAAAWERMAADREQHLKRAESLT